MEFKIKYQDKRIRDLISMRRDLQSREKWGDAVVIVYPHHTTTVDSHDTTFRPHRCVFPPRKINIHLLAVE